LGLDLNRLSDLVLSHGHYDHAGGVETVLAMQSDIQVYLHQAAMQPRYVRENGGARPVRMPPGSMQALWSLEDDSIHWLTQPLKITGRVGLSGPIPRHSSYEDSGGSFYYDPEAERPDPIDDDNALWLRTREGLVICVGCSHAGIVNTIEAVRAVSGESGVHTVVGGLHLLHASPERLEKTARALKSLEIQRIVACHCTGDEAYAYLQSQLSCELTRGYAGLSLSF
ncbi:MAG: MBL fold metallo-hydrolase, partial [Desulfofustis sp.]